MNRLQILKSALIGGASIVTLTNPAAAKLFDIPGGDLATALSTYMKQSDMEVVFSADLVRGHRSAGAKGDYTETAALTQLLRGTGLAARTIPASNAIGIVAAPSEQKPRAENIRVAAAAVPHAPMQGAVETVVVTAQHKSENIQQVPIAITALSQAQLTERQIAGGPDLVKEVPNLTFSKTNFTGYNLEIRGIGTQAISVTTDPAVAVAFNDIPFIRNHFFEQEFFDVQDVEVLRGPQGTLYGRNATAGVVNLKSALPDDSYQAMLSADMGNYSNRRLEGMLNIPIASDKLDIRLAGEWTKRDGYSFNQLTSSPIDGRDLWSTRASLRWRPNADVDVDLIWEHFQEDDDRLRSGKQLCKSAPIPRYVDGVFAGQPGAESFAQADYLSQGCLPTSLYSPDAFEFPNALSLAYYSGLTTALNTIIRSYFDPYVSDTQSLNLRVIDSSINPTYRAKNDTLELNTNYSITPALTFTSQTGYNHDSLWSAEDYNRFDSAPGAFMYSSNPVDLQEQNGLILPDPSLGNVCSYRGDCSPAGIFCDPQLGCSNRLVAEDLSDERAWQFSQEFRLSSNFSGPLNFSFGANYLHYETVENYYVFINTLTIFSASAFGARINNPWVPGVSDDSNCLAGGFRYPNPQEPVRIFSDCIYVDPNSLSNLNNEGHNYFLSQNPYTLNSYAGFGEAYYDLANDLKLTGGLRWTEDRKHFLDIPSELVVGGYGYAVTNVVNQQWNELTGRAAINWTPKLPFTDQTLVYGSYAHGYKAGGANPPGAIFPVFGSTSQTFDPIHPLTFKPEFVEAFELGSKNTLLDGTLTFDGDLFYYNYHDYQISEIVDRTAINLNLNAHVEGAEVEGTWEPAPGLKFNFAGGWENARLANGDQAVDLMDRTAGHPGWMVVKPYVTGASNCILPDYVVAAELLMTGIHPSESTSQACDSAYNAHVDPVTNLPYVPNPVVDRIGETLASLGVTNYPGFDPVSPTATNPDTYLGINAGPAPNNGEGFNKNLSGNRLPNAPPFTLSAGAQYSIPLSTDWAGTARIDYYWQDYSWARVFNDNPYDRLRGYTNVNLALILTSANGWQVMGYVKNVFNVTAITGDFLNSDDSGLTTNVFLTDPRLYGVRVTKQLDQGDGFWGSDYSGADFFTNLFSDADGGKPPLWIELGGQLQRLDDSQERLNPPFLGSITNPALSHSLNVQAPPLYALSEQASVSFQPEGSDWVLLASVQYGRAHDVHHEHHQTANAKVPVHISIPPPFTAFKAFGKYYSFYPDGHVKLADGKAGQSGKHTVVDFQAGKDVGLGIFGNDASSVVSAGVRIAQFRSRTNVDLRAEPDVQYPTAPIIGSVFAVDGAFHAFKSAHVTFHDFHSTLDAKRGFRGIGPSIAWNASVPFVGNSEGSEIAFDWGLNAALLFGRQKVEGRQKSEDHAYYGTQWYQVNFANGLNEGRFLNSGHNVGHVNTEYAHTVAIVRSRSVTIPNIGGSIGLSFRYQNAKVSFGYRADEFFGAMDGGMDTYKSENRGFFGPYANISIGLGG